MAIKKAKTIKGYSPEYWKIISSNYGNMNKRLIVCIGLFKDHESAKNEDNAFIRESISFDLPLADFDTNAVEKGYELVKETAFFSDAIDC